MKKILLTLAFLLPVAVFSQTVTVQQETASKELIEAMNIKSTFGDIMSSVIKTQSVQLPEDKREKFVSVMKAFIQKYFTYETFMPELAKVYAGEFSENELKDLTKFYKSSTGQKFASKQAILTAKGMEIGKKIGLDHKEELTTMMKEAFGEE